MVAAVNPDRSPVEHSASRSVVSTEIHAFLNHWRGIGLSSDPRAETFAAVALALGGIECAEFHRSSPEQTAMARRLAAILAADVVGYSRLMAVDEVGPTRV